MRTLTPLSTTAPSTSTKAQKSIAGRHAQPIHIMAALGFILLALELWLIARWVTGPNFATVPMGPDTPPAWMRIALTVGEVGGAAAALLVAWCYLLRPLMRPLTPPLMAERHMTFEGMMVISFFILSFLDPLGNFIQNWYTYNTYLINFGAILTDIPGSTSYNVRGANVAFPIIFAPAGYIILVAVIAGMNKGPLRMLIARSRNPTLRMKLGYIIVLGAVTELIVEAAILLPFGFYQYGGGPFPLWGEGHYWQYPLQALLHGTLFFSAYIALFHFMDDRGQTLAERGLHRIPEGRKKQMIRFLSCLFVSHAILIGCFHLPTALWGANAIELPQDTQNRSYLTGLTCGRAANRACPSTDLPLTRRGAPWFDYRRQPIPE